MRIPIAAEGRVFVVVPLAVALVALVGFGWFGWPLGVALVGFGLAGFAAFFFRDPQRRPPADPHAVLAAADGVVVDASPRRVSVFLSIFDVHVNRAPVSGEVVAVRRQRGRFRAAFREDAGERNQHNEVEIRNERGVVRVRQIVGVVARRIVCRVGSGDQLTAGERFGLIRFGSRTDILLPDDCRVLVRPGARVRGGETVVGWMP